MLATLPLTSHRALSMAEMTLVVRPRLPMSLGLPEIVPYLLVRERVLSHDHLLELRADGLKHLAVVRHAAAETNSGDALVGLRSSRRSRPASE